MDLELERWKMSSKMSNLDGFTRAPWRMFNATLEAKNTFSYPHEKTVFEGWFLHLSLW